MLLSLFSVIVTGAYLHVDSMSTKAYGQALQRSLAFASGKRQPALDLHELKRKSILIPQDGTTGVEKGSHYIALLAPRLVIWKKN